MRSLFVVVVVFVVLLVLLSPSNAIRSFPLQEHNHLSGLPRFAEAPEYRNGPECPHDHRGASTVHIAMTLDSQYIRGSIGAVHSVIKHASCPENVFFHLIHSQSDHTDSRSFSSLVRSTFPSLNFKLYPFDPSLVTHLISTSIRSALDNPLNYARNYLAHILDADLIHRVIYLDSDLILVDDVSKLWSVPRGRVIAAPEYCRANFTSYFTDAFWSDPALPSGVLSKNPCYFNTGVMVMDLRRWREGGFTRRIERWMEVQRERRIYELGSLPPFLLVFGGDVEPIHHRWNQHGLGGDNVFGSCRGLHPGPVSLLHWSGKGKPWARLDAGAPCPLDHLWAPYDLHLHHQHSHHPVT